MKNKTTTTTTTKQPNKNLIKSIWPCIIENTFSPHSHPKIVTDVCLKVSWYWFLNLGWKRHSAHVFFDGYQEPIFWLQHLSNYIKLVALQTISCLQKFCTKLVEIKESLSRSALDRICQLGVDVEGKIVEEGRQLLCHFCYYVVGYLWKGLGYLVMYYVFIYTHVSQCYIWNIS